MVVNTVYNSPNTYYELHIHEMDSISGVFTTTVLNLNISATSIQYVLDVSVGQRNGSYFIIALFYYASKFEVYYYDITGTTFTQKQIIYSSSDPARVVYSTFNGQFLLLQNSYYLSLY